MCLFIINNNFKLLLILKNERFGFYNRLRLRSSYAVHTQFIRLRGTP